MIPSSAVYLYLGLAVAWGVLHTLSAAVHWGEDRRERIGQVRFAVLIGFAVLALARLAGVL